MNYFDWTNQFLVPWSSVAAAPKHRAVLARRSDEVVHLAENLGEEWMNLADPDDEMGDPAAWAPSPYVPQTVTADAVLGDLTEEDRDMLVACLEGDAAPDHIDREFIEWGIFVPALQPMFTLGGSKHSPSGFGLGWALTEFGKAVAEHIAEADTNA